jgi:uncharacterized protein (TIGR03435 family)
MWKLCRAAVFLGVLVLVAPADAAAQSQAFETISIQPARVDNPGSIRVRVTANGDFSASSVSALTLLIYAYDVPGNPTPRSLGIPLGRGLYDIEAKAPAVPAGLSERDRWKRMQTMLRALLADRFKLVVRAEQKTMPVYALTVASGGPKFQKSAIAEKDCVSEFGNPDSCHGFLAGRGHPLIGKAINMDDLAYYIENWADLPVVNRTALNGLFAVDGEGWKPMNLPPRPPGFPQTPNFDDLPSIFDVLGKLGLELKKQEAAVPVYTVESVAPPALSPGAR